MWFVMLLLSGVTWTLHIAVSAVLWLLGWPICTWCALRSDVWDIYVSTFGRRLLEWSPYLVWLVWGNDEDGIDGLRGGDQAQLWWLEQTKGDSDMWRIVKWSCWRNPVGNLRFVKPFGFLIDPKKVRFVGNSLDPDADYESDPKPTRWYFAWHGLYTGAWLIFRGWQLRIGFKILPRDAQGVSPQDYRSKGCGFALQVQRK